MSDEAEQLEPLPHLPFGWTEHFDSASGDSYYVNETTGQSQWERPAAAEPENLQLNRADSLLHSDNWRRCTSLELDAGNCGVDGDGRCSSLIHDQYEVVPIKRDGNCLFYCFWSILEERAPELLPPDIQSLRGVIADYFDKNSNNLCNDHGVPFRCENIDAIRTGADASGQFLHFGGLPEVFAFSKCYSISIAVFCPEAMVGATTFNFGNSPEFLLQTFGWENQARKREADHWQRLRQRQEQPCKSQSISDVILDAVLPSPYDGSRRSQDKTKTHPKLHNPRNFPLPRSDTVILSESVHLEESKKPIKSRLMQLSITTSNHAELAYLGRDDQSIGSNRIEKMIKLSLAGFAVLSVPGTSGSSIPTVSCTKQGRGVFNFCVRIDVPKKGAVPSVKLVMCFKNVEDQSRWLDAFRWAENRANIRRQHDGFVFADQEAAMKSVETSHTSLNSTSERRLQAASDGIVSQIHDISDPISVTAAVVSGSAKPLGQSVDQKFSHKSVDLTALVDVDMNTLQVSDSIFGSVRTVPIEVLIEPLPQTVLDSMVSLAHSSIRRTLGHLSDSEGLFPVLERPVSSTINAVWLTPSDFASVGMLTRSRWILSIAQAISFLHDSVVAHEPFDLDTSVALFNDSNCQLLVVPRNGVLNATEDWKFFVSFAEKVIMSQPRRSIEFDKVISGLGFKFLNMDEADLRSVAQSWIRMCEEMVRDFLEVPSLHDVSTLFTFQGHRHRKAFAFQIDDDCRFKRTASANQLDRFVFSTDQDDLHLPVFDQFSHESTPIESKKSVLVKLRSYIQCIPENRSLYLEAGYIHHMLLCLSRTSRRQIDDQLQELCLLILSQLLESPMFLTSSWSIADGHKQIEEACKMVCQVLSVAVSLEVQHIALICLKQFSCLMAYHASIYESPSRDQLFVLCLKCTFPNTKPNEFSLSLQVSELSFQVLTNLYLGDRATDIQERKVDIQEPGRFVSRSIFEIIDLLISRLNASTGSHAPNIISRQESLFDATLRFCAILAVDASNHPKFWDTQKPLAVTIFKNVKNFPQRARLHVAHMLKYLTMSVVNNSSRSLWSLDDENFNFCCSKVVLCMSELISLGAVPSNSSTSATAKDVSLNLSSSTSSLMARNRSPSIQAISYFSVLLSSVALEEAVFRALMHFCRMYDFVNQFALFCISHTTIIPWIEVVRLSSVSATSLFLSATINVIIQDHLCTLTPKFLKAGLLSLPVFHPNMKLVKQDSSLYLKVAKCLARILDKNNDLVTDLVLESACIETLFRFISNMQMSVEDVQSQNAAKFICLCFTLLSKNSIACIKLLTFETGGCVPLIIDFFLPHALSETRIECFSAILEILTQCRAIIEMDAVLHDKISLHLCFSESILATFLNFAFRQDAVTSTTSKQQEYIFRCLANLCALTGSNHEILLHLILENSVHRSNFYECLCNFQADDPCRIPSLQLVVELAKMGKDISTIEVMHPSILKFSADIFEHVAFQRRIAAELGRIDLTSDLALLFVRVVYLFSSTEGIVDSVRRVFWHVVRGALESMRANIVAITKRMQKNSFLLSVTSKSTHESEEKIVLICTCVLRNMSSQMAKSPYTHESGKDAIPVISLLFQEPSPCRIVALQVASILASEFGHEADFIRTIVDSPDKKQSFLSKVAQVFCNASLHHDERLVCITFFAKVGSDRQASRVIYEMLMSPTAEGGNFVTLLPSLSPNFLPEAILDTLTIIHNAVQFKIEEGAFCDVRDAFFNSNLVRSLAQLVLPFDSVVGLKAVEVLAEIMDPQPFELQLDSVASSEQLIHLWPHFVSAVSTNARFSSEKLIKAASKILVSRLSMCDAKCLTFHNEPYWSLNANEILALIQSASNSNFVCVQQKCIIAWSLRRIVTASVYKNDPVISGPDSVVIDVNEAISSICVEDIISFLIDSVNSVIESNRYTSSVFSMLNSYITEHVAFVLMHISRHLCNTGQSFQRNIVVLLINVVTSCKEGPQATNFECYILACLHFVVMSLDKSKMIVAADFEKPAFWQRVIGFMKLFPSFLKGNGNDLLLLAPGLSCCTIVLGLFDGLCDFCIGNPQFIHKHVSIPYEEISKQLSSTVADERLHAISILCKLARMSNAIPEIISAFWKHPSVSIFVQGVQEMLETGETVVERELACGFIYFSSKRPKEFFECWDEIFEIMCHIFFDYNGYDRDSLHQSIARAVLLEHVAVSITALNCLLHFSSLFLHSISHPSSHIMTVAFQQDLSFFQSLAVIERRPSFHSFAPILREEYEQLAEDGRFDRFFSQKILEFFFNTSSVSNLAPCFINQTIIEFILNNLRNSYVSWLDSSTFEDKPKMSHFGDNSVPSEAKIQAIEIILNLLKFCGAEMLNAVDDAGITPLLLDILKDPTSPDYLISCCLNALSQVAFSQHAKTLIQRDYEFLSRIPSFLNFIGGYRRPDNTSFHVLVLLRKVTQVPEIRDFLVSESNGVDIFRSVLESFERDSTEIKLQALGVLSNLVANDVIKAELVDTNFLLSMVETIRLPTTEEHLKLSVTSFVNICSDSPSSLAMVAALPGLVEVLCKHYLDPLASDAIKDSVSELLIWLSHSPSTVSLSGGLYLQYMSAKPEPFIHLLCRVLCFQVSSNGTSKLASLRLLYTTSIKSSNVNIIADYMIQDCRELQQNTNRIHSLFEILVILLASTSSSERELAASIFSGVSKIRNWAKVFASHCVQIKVADCTSLIHAPDTFSLPQPLVPVLLHCAGQSQFQTEAIEAISALASLSDHEEFLCQILLHEPNFERLARVVTSDTMDSSIKSSYIFSNLGVCSKTQAALGKHLSTVLSLADTLPRKVAIDDPRLRNVIKCFLHLSRSTELEQLLNLCHNRVLTQVVQHIGGIFTFEISEFLLNLCRAFSQKQDVLDRFVSAGTVMTLITNVISTNFELRIVQNCFSIFNILKSVPGVVSQLSDNRSFIELVCKSIYFNPKNSLLDAAILLLHFSADEENRHRLFPCIVLVKDACKFLLRSNLHQQEGALASTAQETCVGADILSNIAMDFCHLEDFTSFFQLFPEHLWFQQNFMAPPDIQAPNALVQESCTRAICALCEGKEECFRINQVACANACFAQLYGLLEHGATDLAKINAARSLCSITAHPQNAEVRTLLANKISPDKFWHVPLLIIRRRNPEEAVRYCLGLICHLAEDPGRGAALAMVPLKENFGGATRQIEWTLFESLNNDDLSERLYAMRIFASICVEQPSARVGAHPADSLTGDVARRVMRSNVGIGVFYQLMEQFRVSVDDEEKERICMILEKFSASPEFECQLRVHDHECFFLTNLIHSSIFVVSTIGCSIIKNACNSASLLSKVAENDHLLSALCQHIQDDDDRSHHVLQTFVLLVCVGNFRRISIFDDSGVLKSIVRLLGSKTREVRCLSCKLLLALSDGDDLGPRNFIIMKSAPLPDLVAIIKDTPFIESKTPMLLMAKLCLFPESQEFLHRDIVFVREMAMKVTHGRGTDLSSEKSQIALTALCCIARMTRHFETCVPRSADPILPPTNSETRDDASCSTHIVDADSQSSSYVREIFSCSQILSSAKECIDVSIESETFESQINYAFINYAMEIFYNMSKVETLHQEMLDPRHQLLPLWCRFFNYIPSPTDTVQGSIPTFHLQHILLILNNLVQSRTWPLQPFTVCSMNVSFFIHLEALLNRFCLTIDDQSVGVPPLKNLILSTLQLFIRDRRTLNVLIDSERTHATSLVVFLCKHLSRKRSTLPNVDSVIESMLHVICTLTTDTEHLPVIINCISCSGRDVLLDYMRQASEPKIATLVLKTLLNISRCSDQESVAILSGSGGTITLTDWLLHHIFTKPNASTSDMHLSMSTLFNLRHLMAIDAPTIALLRHKKEYRDKAIEVSRTLHFDSLGAALRLICLKFISFVLHLCISNNKLKCYDNTCFKLLAHRTRQASTGSEIQSLLDIATLRDVHSSPLHVQLDLTGNGAHIPGDYLISNIDKPLMEGTPERLVDIEKAICQHACAALCAVFCQLQPTLQLINEAVDELLSRGSKLYVPIISHIQEGSCLPVVVKGCSALAAMSKHARFVQSFSDHIIISTLLTLLDRPTATSVSENVADDIMTAIVGFSVNSKCIPYGLCDSNTGGDRMVGVLSRWFLSCRPTVHKVTTLSIIEQITCASSYASHLASDNDVDALLVAVAENPNFGLAFISAQLDSSSISPYPNCVNILFNILASSRVRGMLTSPTSFYNCTCIDILCRLIRADESKSNAALSCLNSLCQDSDLACKLITTDLIEFVMNRILQMTGRFQQSNIDAFQLLQNVFSKYHPRVAQMFDAMPHFFENIITLSSSDNEVLLQHSSRLVLSICSAEDSANNALFEVLIRKDICSYVSYLRDSHSAICVSIATQIARKLLLSRVFMLQVEQRVRLFSTLQCGIFSRLDCNWPTHQAPTTFKCAVEGTDDLNGVDFSCIALPGGHYNIQSTQELILVHHNTALGSVYCVVTVSRHPTNHIVLLRYRDAISHFFSEAPGPSRTSSDDLQAFMCSFVCHVAELSRSTHLGANLLFVAVTHELVLWSSISSIPGLAHHKLFLPSSIRCLGYLESKFETAIGNADLCLLDRPSTRSCFVIGSEGFCRFMSDSQVADAINVLSLDSPTAQSGQALRLSGDFLSVAKDLVNICTLGRVSGVPADDEDIPECSCILLHLQHR